MSPLHFRHGCVIVRGGKVIGQGYNSYRPGFDGGALKHGNIHGLHEGPTIAELKQRLKFKSKTKSKSKSDNRPSLGTFTPFEATGRNLNVPLSMHSEMMAIQSALSLSSGALSSQTSARSAKWLQKPNSKLSGMSKRKTRLRNIQVYVKAVCEEAGEAMSAPGKWNAGKFSLQESCFEAYPSQSDQERGELQVQREREERKEDVLGSTSAEE